MSSGFYDWDTNIELDSRSELGMIQENLEMNMKILKA